MAEILEFVTQSTSQAVDHLNRHWLPECGRILLAQRDAIEVIVTDLQSDHPPNDVDEPAPANSGDPPAATQRDPPEPLQQPLTSKELRVLKMNRFFNSVATLMSNLLRRIVEDTIVDIVALFEEYMGGNMYEGEYLMIGPLGLPTKIHIIRFFLAC